MNRKTSRFFKGYQGNKPIWTDLPINAVHYDDIEIMKRLRKRLACQSQDTQLVIRTRNF